MMLIEGHSYVHKTWTMHMIHFLDRGRDRHTLAGIVPDRSHNEEAMKVPQPAIQSIVSAAAVCPCSQKMSVAWSTVYRNYIPANVRAA